MKRPLLCTLSALLARPGGAQEHLVSPTLSVISSGANFSCVLSARNYHYSCESAGATDSKYCNTGQATAECWGQNDHSQLSPPNGWFPYGRFIYNETQTSMWATLSAGSAFVCGVLSTWEAVCWGANETAQLVVPQIASDNPSSDELVAPEIVRVGCGGSTCCGVQSNRHWLCWGDGT